MDRADPLCSHVLVKHGEGGPSHKSACADGNPYPVFKRVPFIAIPDEHRSNFVGCLHEPLDEQVREVADLFEDGLFHRGFRVVHLENPEPVQEGQVLFECPRVMPYGVPVPGCVAGCDEPEIRVGMNDFAPVFGDAQGRTLDDTV